MITRCLNPWCHVSEFNMAEFKMAAIINLSQNEWVKFILCKMAESKLVDFKMAAIIKLSQNEWVKFFCANGGEGNVSKFFFVQIVGTNLGKCEWVSEKKLKWLNPRCGIQVGRIQDDCYHQVRWKWISLSQSQIGVRVFLSESERW